MKKKNLPQAVKNLLNKGHTTKEDASVKKISYINRIKKEKKL
jgi:hypothetical protein